MAVDLADMMEPQRGHGSIGALAFDLRLAVCPALHHILSPAPQMKTGAAPRGHVPMLEQVFEVCQDPGDLLE